MAASKRSHVVVLALSDLKPYQGGSNPMTSYTYDVQGFLCEGIPDQYQAWYTNEGPIKLLIDLAIHDHNPITRIVYLRSERCRTQEVTLGERVLTAEQYFKQCVLAHLQEHDLAGWASSNAGFFVPIDYDLAEPVKSLRDIIAEIGTNATVDVDVSGAQRDAQLLVSHAIEFVQAATTRNSSVRLGATVYANLDWSKRMGTLVNQKETYDLSSLINAVNAFTRYGRAGMLVEFFGDEGASAASRLCLSMRDFSDDLLLCRMGNISDLVSEIQQRLDELEQSARDNELNGSEILLASLVPTIRADFVQATADDPLEHTIEIIRWCVDRRMLQQALALYRERAPRLMIEQGFMRSIDPNLEGEKLIAAVRNCTESFIDGLRRLVVDKPEGKEKRARTRALRVVTFEQVSQIVPEKEHVGKLAANLIWYYYLSTIRNDTMHAKDRPEAENRRGLLECSLATYVESEAVTLRYDAAENATSHMRNKALAEDICKALDVLEGNVELHICDELSTISEKSLPEIQLAVIERNAYAKNYIDELHASAGSS